MSTDPATQAEAQLRRIEQTLGRTAADVAQEIKGHGIDRHSDVVAFLKSTHGLTHGNANLMAHVARQLLAGGPAAPEDLLAAQYAGPKAALLPLYGKLSALAEALGPDVVKVVQKTGVSFRRKKQCRADSSRLSQAPAPGTEPRRHPQRPPHRRVPRHVYAHRRLHHHRRRRRCRRILVDSRIHPGSLARQPSAVLDPPGFLERLKCDPDLPFRKRLFPGSPGISPANDLLESARGFLGCHPMHRGEQLHSGWRLES